MSDSINRTTEWVRLVGRYPDTIPPAELSAVDEEVRRLLKFGQIYVDRTDPSRTVTIVKVIRTSANVKPEHYRVRTDPPLDRDDSRVHHFLEQFTLHASLIGESPISRVIAQDLI